MRLFATALVAGLLAVPTAALAETQKWTADADHTAAQFEVRHMMVSTVRGAFSGVEATLELDEKDASKSKVTARIPVETIDTRNQKRDAHLRSGDFFDAENHPYLTFTSTRVVPKGDNRYDVHGNLTMRGVTKPVVMDVEASPPVKNPFSGTPVRGFHGEAEVNRKDFGLNWNKALEAGGVLVGDEVKIVIDAEFAPAAEEQARQ